MTETPDRGYDPDTDPDTEPPTAAPGVRRADEPSTGDRDERDDPAAPADQEPPD